MERFGLSVGRYEVQGVPMSCRLEVEEGNDPQKISCKGLGNWENPQHVRRVDSGGNDFSVAHTRSLCSDFACFDPSGESLSAKARRV